VIRNGTKLKMKTILIFVTTLDGKITRWGDPDIRSWSSVNDQDYFDSVWNSTRVILMGRATYTAFPVNPGPKHTFIVMTRHPEDYNDKEVPGKLEFTDELPLSIVTRFENSGEENMLIVGGSEIATLFLKENLIKELWLTFEPKICGHGGSFVGDEKFDIDLKLISVDKINDKGTIVVKYSVERRA
jgi:dihydrofolate reductase